MRELKPYKNGWGYLRVNLSNENGRKGLMIHRLVALTYISNPDNKPTVDHKNRNKLDNRVENLRWATMVDQSNNRKEHPKNDKNSKPVLCVETKVVYPSMSECSRQTGFSQGHISSCCRGKLKTAYGYHWQYV